MNKVYILAIVAIVAFFPHPAQAVRIGNIFDPLCLFSWRDGCKDNTTIDNSINGSFNVNSNVNSPGGVVSGNTNNTNTGTPTTNPHPYPGTNTLYVSCSPSTYSAYINDLVTWSASASGGTGTYTYEWSGTNIGSTGGSSVSTRYGSSGSKYASVTVRSGTQTASQSCGYVYVRQNDNYYYDNNYDYNYNYNYDYNRYNYDNYYNYYNFSVQCYPDVTRTSVGSYVTWRAIVSGGSGYYEYSWSGTEGLYGTNISATYPYSRTGTKYASVTVRSANRSVSQSCGTVIVDDGYYSNVNSNVYGGNLSVSCSPSVAYAKTGAVVSWTAYPVGGNGVYTYSWSGSDGFTGAQKSVSTSYQTIGSKYAVATVSSAGQNASIGCGTVTVSKTSTVKAPAIKKPTQAPIVNTGNDTVNTSFNAFAQVPWMFVMMIIILILFVTVLYLVVSKK